MWYLDTQIHLFPRSLSSQTSSAHSGHLSTEINQHESTFITVCRITRANPQHYADHSFADHECRWWTTTCLDFSRTENSRGIDCPSDRLSDFENIASAISSHPRIASADLVFSIEFTQDLLRDESEEWLPCHSWNIQTGECKCVRWNRLEGELLLI